MPNELDEIRELYESNKKKMDIIRGLSKKSVAKLPKETQEELIKQTKKFDGFRMRYRKLFKINDRFRNGSFGR